MAASLTSVSNEACDTLYACSCVSPSGISKKYMEQSTPLRNRTLRNYTHYFFYSTNHHDTQALQQLLLKQNRLEYLTDNSYARSKEKPALCVNSQDTSEPVQMLLSDHLQPSLLLRQIQWRFQICDRI